MNSLKNMIYITIVLCLLLSLSVTSFESSEDRYAKKYLSDFYDFEKTSDNFEDSLKDMQRFAGIEADGKLSPEVIAHMNKGRCGGKDNYKKRQKRYVTGSKWESGRTYNFYIHTDWLPRTMTEAEVRRSILVGMQYWQRAAKIGFRESRNTAGCKFSLSFGGYHHKMYDVDENFKSHIYETDVDNVPGGVLAHAYMPTWGNVHFDNAETWTEGTVSGINLRLVTAHEMGHAIGLYHSHEREALMYPWYAGYIPEDEYRLPEDDQKGAQSLYGSWDKRSLPKKIRQLGKIQSRLCSVNDMESIFQFNDNKVYVVAENGKLFRLNGTTVDETFEPAPLHVDLKGADSIFFDDENKRLIIFKGDNVLTASGPDIDNLNIGSLNISGRGLYLGRSSASFARSDSSAEGSKYFWIVQDKELISGMVNENNVVFSRRSRPFSEIFEMSNNGKFPPSIDAAFVFGENDKNRLYLFVGNSYFLAKPRGVKETTYLIPAEYPKSFKALLGC